MPNILDRETFTLLNLSESGSESVPDLDLVQPTKKVNKRKVKYKRRDRGIARLPKPASDLSSEQHGCGCGSLPYACRVGGLLLLVTCLASLLYLSYSLAGKLRVLEMRVLSVDDASKTVPASILQIKSSLENMQSNETFFHNGLKEMDKRLNGLEDSINKLNNKPQPEDVQQSLAELGGKLTELKQVVDTVKNRTVGNTDNLNKIAKELQAIKLNEVEMRASERQGLDTSQLAGLNMSLLETNKLVVEEKGKVDKIEARLGSLSTNSTARMDWFTKDINQLKGKLSQMEDDNRNTSSHLQSHEADMKEALRQVNLDLSYLNATISQVTGETDKGKN